jgi:hypothetical protein
MHGTRKNLKHFTAKALRTRGHLDHYTSMDFILISLTDKKLLSLVTNVARRTRAVAAIMGIRELETVFLSE